MFEIDKNLKYEYKLELCKPNKKPIKTIDTSLHINNFNYEARFPTTDEISFNIPYYITYRGKKLKNKLWDLAKGDYLIRLQRIYHQTIVDEKYFIIIKPDEVENDTAIKEITAYSLEYELNKKKVRGYNLVSRKIHSLTDEVDDEGYKIGVLNYITTLTSWSIGDIDADLITKFRAFDADNISVLDFLVNHVQKAFGCIFIFDTINRTINAKRIEVVGQNKGLYLSEQNYIKSINKDVDHDEIVTRLYVYGKDGLSIQAFNPSGQTFVEDFSYYRNLEYMSQDLLTALDDYDNLLETKNNEFQDYLTELEDLDSQLTIKQNELTTLETEMQVIQDNIDVAIQSNDQSSLDTYNQEKDDKQTEIDDKNIEIDDINDQTASVYSDIATLQESIKKENNFTEDQLIELDFFVREDTWTDTNYETAEDLWNEVPNVFAKINQPPLTFDIESVDFLQVLECQRDWKKLILGDIINIEHHKFNFYIQVRLVGYTHNIDDNSLKLKFSSRNSIDDPVHFMNDIRKNAITTSNTVNMSKFKWDKSEDNSNQISEIVNNDLDTSNRAVLAGQNQVIKINERGIALTDSTNPDEQLRMINNVIAMTTDNWNTADLAITPQGIIARRLIGNIIAGNELTIENESGTFIVDGLGMTATNMNLSLIGNDGNNQILFNPDDGFKIQQADGSGNWIDNFYADLNGRLQAIDMDISGDSTFSGSITVGSGANIFKVDENGIYLGSEDFDEAPFRVGLNGQLYAEDAYINGSTMINGTIYGSSINVNDMFVVTSEGDMTALNGKFTGDITSSTATFETPLVKSEFNIENPFAISTTSDNGLTWDKKMYVDTDGKLKAKEFQVISEDGNNVVLDQYGIDTQYSVWFKNMIYNSSFEVGDTTPKYWVGSGTKYAESSMWGSYSLKLSEGQTIRTATVDGDENQYSLKGIFWSDVGVQSGLTRLSFYKKGGSIYVAVVNTRTENSYLLIDQEGNSDENMSTGDSTNWDTRYSYSFLIPEDELNDNIYVGFISQGTDAYIDGVQLEPDKTGKWASSYKDGQNSSSADIAGNELDKLEFKSDGFIATYGEEVQDYSWTKDSQGRITELTDNDTGKVIPITWSD